jgi:hypothetical protein
MLWVYMNHAAVSVNPAAPEPPRLLDSGTTHPSAGSATAATAA